MVSGGCDDDATLGRTEDWGLKGRRAMSVGLGGWEYNPVVRIAKEKPGPSPTPPCWLDLARLLAGQDLWPPSQDSSDPLKTS